jgi:hypothetical protein
MKTQNHKLSMKNGLAPVLLLCGLLFGHQAYALDSNSSPLGAYASTNTFCGNEAIPQNITAIPWIGCFSLSAGHTASETFSGHNVEVAVDAAGQEAFTVDGTLVTDIFGPHRPASGTNLPFVHECSGSGYSFCQAPTSASCSPCLTVFSRNPDKSVLFMVSECFPPTNHVCVSTQRNWDFEKSRQR